MASFSKNLSDSSSTLTTLAKQFASLAWQVGSVMFGDSMVVLARRYPGVQKQSVVDNFTSITLTFHTIYQPALLAGSLLVVLYPSPSQVSLFNTWFAGQSVKRVRLVPLKHVLRPCLDFTQLLSNIFSFLLGVSSAPCRGPKLVRNAVFTGCYYSTRNARNVC